MIHKHLVGFLFFCLLAGHSFIVIQQDWTVPSHLAAQAIDSNGFQVIKSTGWSPLAYRTFSDRLSSGFLAVDQCSGDTWKIGIIQMDDGSIVLRRLWIEE